MLKSFRKIAFAGRLGLKFQVYRIVLLELLNEALRLICDFVDSKVMLFFVQVFRRIRAINRFSSDVVPEDFFCLMR